MGQGDTTRNAAAAARRPASNGHGQPKGDGGLQDVFQLARNGSSEALGTLLEGCRQYLLLVANQELERELAAKTGASDLVQETFLSARCHFSQFHGITESELLAWLRPILRNHLAAVRRHFMAEKRCAARELSLDDSRFKALQYQLVAKGSSPSSHAVHGELALVLHRLLVQLPQRFQQVIQLRHREQLPFDEVGRRIELSADAARQLWARAIQRLQREWKTNHRDGDGEQ